MKEPSMRSLVYLLAITLGGPALCAPRTYDLKLEFRLNDKVEKNHIVVQEGKSKTVTDLFGKEKFFCEVAVNEKSQDGKAKLFIRFAVGDVDPNGKKLLIAKSEVFATDHEPSEDSIIGNNGEEALRITVIATRLPPAAAIPVPPHTN
jgi:hypothetical protein